MKKENSKIKGNITELETAVALIRRGCGVCIPYGDRNKYDLVADVDGEFIRLQCKTSRTKDGGKTFGFSERSSHTKDGVQINEPYSPSEVDYFATVFNNKCYLYPVTGACSSDRILRLSEPKQGSNESRINWAKDYEVDVVLSRIRGKQQRLKNTKNRIDSP